VKELVFFCAHASSQLDPGTASFRLVRTCCWSLSECFGIFDRAGRYLSAEGVRRACQLGDLFTMSYIKLAEISLNEGVCLWKVRPKLHDWQEILARLQHDRTNPNYVCCLPDESMLLVFKTTTRACHPKTAPLRVALRYLGQLMLRLEEIQRGPKHV
jgi:hypothetical protein